MCCYEVRHGSAALSSGHSPSFLTSCDDGLVSRHQRYMEDKLAKHEQSMEEVKAQVNKTQSLILALAEQLNQIVVPTSTPNVRRANGLSWEAGKADSRSDSGGGPFVSDKAATLEARPSMSALNPDLKMERQPADRSSRIDGGIKERRQNGIHNVSWRHDEGMSARSDALTPRTPTTDNLRAETQLSRRRWELSVRLKLVFRSGAEVGRWLIVNTKFA